ncbi:MAG: hypothetical protein OHK0056_21780 [Bacteriovoracaceae bacterium]
MTTIDDGVIKFSLFNQERPLPDGINLIKALEQWRKKLYQLEFIGEYKAEKVGFGNLSCLTTDRGRADKPEFLITGTQTGHLPDLNEDYYTIVYDYDLLKNTIYSEGPMKPSSESLTHAAIYLANPKIKAVFHGHHKSIWQAMIKENYPSTGETIPYGTINMAVATQDLVYKNSTGIFVMKGHEDGIVAWGENLDQAGERLLEVYHKFQR